MEVLGKLWHKQYDNYSLDLWICCYNTSFSCTFFIALSNDKYSRPVFKGFILDPNCAEIKRTKSFFCPTTARISDLCFHSLKKNKKQKNPNQMQLCFTMCVLGKLTGFFDPYRRLIALIAISDYCCWIRCFENNCSFLICTSITRSPGSAGW